MSMRSFSNSKIAAILALDVECIYLCKLNSFLQYNMLDTFIRPHNFALLLGWDMTSQNQALGEGCKNFSKIGWYFKKGESSQKVDCVENA